jgi:hypothetical protein
VKTVKMQGGIGNQLFCLAFAHSVAALSGEPVAIDLAAFGSSRYGHHFALGDLANDLGDFRLVRRPFMAARLTTALMRAAPAPGYRCETAPPADEAAFGGLITGGRYFNGYWQHEAYIARPEEFVARTREAVLRRVRPATRRDIVIHYRTYREEIRAQARRTPGADYVRAALAQIDASLGRCAGVSLVSDDPALAVRALGDLGREVTVVAGGPWEDLALLMNARALVLTNSSFSWWGGFCGEAEMVVYPRPGGYLHYPMPPTRFACV